MKSIWTVHKELYQTTTDVIIRKKYEQIPVLEDLLKKHRDVFLNVIKNPVSETN